MGGNDGKSGASQTDIDAKLFKVLYELEVRLDAKFKEARQQNKEDTQVIVELAVNRAVQPLAENMRAFGIRLEEGNRRFDEQSSRITKVKDLAVQAVSDAMTAKTEAKLQLVDAEGEKKPKEGWISASTLVAFLPALGSLIATVLASVALLRTPAQPSQPTPAPPTPLQAQTPP